MVGTTAIAPAPLLSACCAYQRERERGERERERERETGFTETVENTGIHTSSQVSLMLSHPT